VILGRALLGIAAAMLVAGRGALGFPEARAPLSASSRSDCSEQRAATGAARPSSQAYSALMP
jgi:hypothetical protein